ncbi:phospholipase A [Caldimonas thermodepolymerans]|nr:phospholipase A [Caldimonas thermodepolymerans]
MRLRPACVGLGLWVAAWSAGAQAPAGLADCAAIEADAERLACYDRVAGRSAPVPAPAAAQAPAAEPPARVTMPAPLPAEAAPADEAPQAASAGSGLRPRSAQSFWSAFWELDRADKHGTFRFKSYRPNFILPVHYTSHINRDPQSPTRPSDGEPNDYKQIETKLQISLRTKIAQSVLLPDADIWFGYTQQSMWQVWNRKESSPFRSTDFEPELIYVVPVPKPLRLLPHGWEFRMVHAGLAHQSNGQSEPLSRSWNRVYVAAGLEKGEVSILARLHKRLPEDGDDDDNPDLTHYLGRGEVTVAWLPGRATASLRWRSNLRDVKHGSWQLDWTYPVDSDHPEGLRWYVQLFSGYGETLLDYNRQQHSLGVGITLFQF